ARGRGTEGPEAGRLRLPRRQAAAGGRSRAAGSSPPAGWRPGRAGRRAAPPADRTGVQLAWQDLPLFLLVFPGAEAGGFLKDLGEIEGAFKPQLLGDLVDLLVPFFQHFLGGGNPHFGDVLHKAASVPAKQLAQVS